MVAGRGPTPRLVLSLVAALPAGSRTVAERLGGPEFRGWDETRSLLAAIYDAMNVNTRATGHWKSKPPKIPEWPRPKSRSEAKKPKTVKELYAAFGGTGER